METKYKVLLSAYAAFMAYFMLVVPWRGHGSYGDATAIIFSPPYPGSSIDSEEVMFHLFAVTVVFGIIYLVVRKMAPTLSRWLG